MASGSVCSLSLLTLGVHVSARGSPGVSATVFKGTAGGRVRRGSLLIVQRERGGRGGVAHVGGVLLTFQARESDTKERWEERDRERW